MKVVKINRQRWHNGSNNRNPGGGKSSSMLKNDGTMCCLGHACQQISKFPKSRLKNHPFPNSIYKGESFLTIGNKHGGVKNNEFASRAAEINDNQAYTNEDARENDLIRLFKKNNIKLSFFGERRPAN